MSVVEDDASSGYSRTTTLAEPSYDDRGRGKSRASVTKEFGIIVEMDELDDIIDVDASSETQPGRSAGRPDPSPRASDIDVDHEVVNDARQSPGGQDSADVDDAITLHDSRRVSLYSQVDTPGAGPSRGHHAGPYHTSFGSGSRRSLRFENSKTSFLDVTEEVSGISKYPVSEGAYCDVHEGQLTGEGKVALKRLRLLGGEIKVRKRFRYEAEIWYRLSHPNVLRLYGLYLDGPAFYMVSPWQENGSLSAYIKDKQDIDRVKLLQQVADALTYLHSNDPIIIHGDIKGQNVLISTEGTAILCDFGLSMILSEIAGISTTPTGVQDGGSTRYMAPELMQGEQSKTCLSDTYAYAMLMVETFSGAHPFPKLRYDATLVKAIISGQRPPCPLDLEGVEKAKNKRIWRLIQACWLADPQLRPVMSNVNGLLQNIIDNTEIQNSVLKEYVISGVFDLEGYVQRASKSVKTWTLEGGREEPASLVRRETGVRLGLEANSNDRWKYSPQNPHNWSFWRKGGMVCISLAFVVLSTMSNTIMAPVLPQVAERYNVHNITLNNMGFSVFTLALSFGPLVCLPLSEVFGRLWVFHSGVVILTAFNLACAYAPSIGAFIAFRFLAGLGGSVMGISIVILVDIFKKHRRMVASSTSSISIFMGSSIGPVIGGQITEKVGLKWIFLVSGIACGAMGVVGAIVLRESYAPVLQYRMQTRHNLDKERGDGSNHDREFDDPRRRFSTVMKRAIIRPFKVPFTHFMCSILLLYVGILSGIYYLLLATFPVVFQDVYSFSVGETGLIYLGPSAGILLSVGTVVLLHRIFGHLPTKTYFTTKGDPRILMLICTAFTVPVGLFIYGWTVQEKVHHIAPVIGAAYFAFTMAAIFLPVQYYLIDAITVVHPSSGMAAVSIARFTFGFAFPLFGQQMLDRLGHGATYSILAGLTIVFGIIIPLIAYFFGGSKGVRLFSGFTSSTMTVGSN